MKFFVTGGAGFVGSHIVDRLLTRGSVTVYDNLSLGTLDNLAHHHDAQEEGRLTFVEGDVLDRKALGKAMADHDVVFHLAANSDISQNDKTDIDLNQGILATYNVLEEMRLAGIKRIVFTSSSVIFGEQEGAVFSEDHGPCLPISFYGASKLAAEGLITAFCHNFGLRCWIYRFANIVGSRGTHGALVDFIKKLKKDPRSLEVLGDGKQSKPYLEVNDCADGMLFGFDNASDEVNVFNLANTDAVCVTDMANAIVTALGLKDVEIRYTGADRGWRGDVPKVRMTNEKMATLGWTPVRNSEQAVEKAAADLAAESAGRG
ncbi:MAG: NAD-dependent epimerase/dehydratase family protein [archaeon]